MPTDQKLSGFVATHHWSSRLLENEMAANAPRAKSPAVVDDEADVMPGAHVMIVEDEQDLQDLLVYNLNRKGLRTTAAERGEDALKILRDDRNPKPDVILLDLMLPGMDGMEVCKAIKATPSLAEIPVIMVTAKGEEADVVAGLESGADDYVTKPFSTRVLLARVQSVLRRKAGAAVAGGEESGTQAGNIRIRGIEINPERHEVLVEGSPVELTATEFRLLCLLAGKPGRVFTRQQIIESVHGWNVAVTDRSVDVHIVSLRRKLGETGASIQTIRGVGYRFKE